MKKPIGMFFLILAILCLTALPAIAENMEELETKYDEYLSQQEDLEQIAEIEANKVAFAQELAARWEAEALERGNDESWLERISAILSEEDAETLLSKSEAESWDDFIGSGSHELVFYPLKPCRIVDTRFATRWGPFGTPLASGQTIAVKTHSSLAGQGGASNCLVSSDSAAVVINVTVVPVSGGQGFLTVWPYMQSWPTASLVNYNSGSTSGAIANAVSQSQCRLCSYELNVYARKTTHVIIDVIGYFARNRATPLSIHFTHVSMNVCGLCARTLDSAPCLPGYVVTGGGCDMNTWNSSIYRTMPGGPTYNQQWRCGAKNNDLVTRVLTAHSICARIPGAD